MISEDRLLVGLGALQALAGRPRMAARDPGVVALGERWQRELDALTDSWQQHVAPRQLTSLEHQIEAAVHAHNPAALTRMQVSDSGAMHVEASMRSMAQAGAESVVAEAKRAGLDLGRPPVVAALTLADWAKAAADVLTSGLALAAGREALRQWRPGALAADVVDGVRQWHAGLTDRGLRDVLGGALTRAQNLGKMAAYRLPHEGWKLTLIADETLDSNTCQPCRAIDGTELPSPDAAALAYGGAGYLFCQGGERCRGTVRGEWERQPDPQRAQLDTMLAGLRDLDPGGTQ